MLCEEKSLAREMEECMATSEYYLCVIGVDSLPGASASAAVVKGRGAEWVSF